MSARTIRLFIATRIEEGVATRIAKAFSPLRSRVGRASWVSPQAYHLTYAFLGEHDESEASRVAGFLPEALRSVSHYEGAISGGGCFPNERRPRVGWLAFSHPDTLVNVANVVRRSLDRESVAYDAKPFKPHLTVVRVRQKWTRRDMEMFLETCDALGSVDLTIDRVSLFRSELRPDGAKHHELAEVKLRGNSL